MVSHHILTHRLGLSEIMYAACYLGIGVAHSQNEDDYVIDASRSSVRMFTFLAICLFSINSICAYVMFISLNI
jgi:hypothetical protein